MSKAKPWKRRLIRTILGLLAALALLQGVRTWEAAGREVQLSYRSSAALLEVSLYDKEGKLLRRSSFGRGAARSHSFKLPEGSYWLECGGRRERFEIGDDISLTLDCSTKKKIQ